MNIKLIRKITILTITLVSIVVITFIVNFQHHGISNNISDWGNFGSYISGIINPILSGLNIYIFFILTKTASEFGTQNVRKQLSFITCQEYQNKINDLTFEFLANIETYKENQDKKYIIRATNRLNWIKFFIDSFVKEAEPLIPQNLPEIKKQKEEFELSINMLIKSEFSEVEPMELFFDKKSEFIQSVFKFMIK